VDSSPPYGAASGVSPARAAAGSHSWRVRDAPDQPTDDGWGHLPPLWHDGPERPIHRPRDGEEQQEYDSGKKKCHTINNLLIIDETCQICVLSATYEGKANDKRLAELEGYRLPPGSCLSQDRGFQGFALAGVTMVQPKKKPRGGELTPPEKATNRRISAIRIRMEHAIGGVKRYRIVQDKIRLLKDWMRDPVLETCGGLHNFRLQYRPWNYAS
jgi:hypothetical protein